MTQYITSDFYVIGIRGGSTLTHGMELHREIQEILRRPGLTFFKNL